MPTSSGIVACSARVMRLLSSILRIPGVLATWHAALTRASDEDLVFRGLRAIADGRWRDLDRAIGALAARRAYRDCAFLRELAREAGAPIDESIV